MSIVYVMVALFASSIGIVHSKRSVNSVNGMTTLHSYPGDLSYFAPTITIKSSFEPTKAITFDPLLVYFPLTTLLVINPYKLSCLITPTKFVDFTKSKSYTRLWQRTHRGIHWLPPKPTI